MASPRRNRQRAIKRIAAKQRAAQDTDAAKEAVRLPSDAAVWPFQEILAEGEGELAYKRELSDLTLVRRAVRGDWLPDEAHVKRAAILSYVGSHLDQHRKNDDECGRFLAFAGLLLDCDKADLRRLRRQREAEKGEGTA